MSWIIGEPVDDLHDNERDLPPEPVGNPLGGVRISRRAGKSEKVPDPSAVREDCCPYCQTPPDTRRAGQQGDQRVATPRAGGQGLRVLQPDTLRFHHNG